MADEMPFAVVLTAVKHEIGRILDDRPVAESLTEESPLFALDSTEESSVLNLDSLDVLELLLALEEELGLQLRDDVDLETIWTLGDIVRALESTQ